MSRFGLDETPSIVQQMGLVWQVRTIASRRNARSLHHNFDERLVHFHIAPGILARAVLDETISSRARAPGWSS